MKLQCDYCNNKHKSVIYVDTKGFMCRVCRQLHATPMLRTKRKVNVSFLGLSKQKHNCSITKVYQGGAC